MLVIRLQRIGKKGQPGYRLVVAERRSKLTASPTEDLGSYSSSTKQARFKGERVSYWLKAGAKASPTAHNLLVREGIVSAPKVRIKMKKKKAAEAASEGAQA